VWVDQKCMLMEGLIGHCGTAPFRGWFRCITHYDERYGPQSDHQHRCLAEVRRNQKVANETPEGQAPKPKRTVVRWAARF
jgi:hypothetical protein